MTIQSEYEHLRELFGSAGSLPQLPKSPLRLSKMLDSTDSNPIEIERLILSDPALTAGLLRSASSVYHARTRPVTTVREAIMVLGFRSLRSMAIALWTQSLIVEASRRSFFDASRFTKNGSFVGYLSSAIYQDIGKKVQSWTAEEVYAGGVLSNISMGLLAVLHPAAFDSVYVLARDNQWTLERSFALRYEHKVSELGPQAAHALGLPDLFRTVIEHIQSPHEALDFFHPLACLNYARAIADSSGYGLQRWPVEFIVSGSVTNQITIDEQRMCQLVEDTRKHTILNCPASAA